MDQHCSTVCKAFIKRMDRELTQPRKDPRKMWASHDKSCNIHRLAHNGICFDALPKYWFGMMLWQEQETEAKAPNVGKRFCSTAWSHVEKQWNTCLECWWREQLNKVVLCSELIIGSHIMTVSFGLSKMVVCVQKLAAASNWNWQYLFFSPFGLH